MFIPCQETAIFGSAHGQTEESTDRRFGQNVAVLEALADNKSRQLRLIPIVAQAGVVSIGQTRGVAEIRALNRLKDTRVGRPKDLSAAIGFTRKFYPLDSP